MSDINAVTYDGLVVVVPGTTVFSEPAAGFMVLVSGLVNVVTRKGQTPVLLQANQGVEYHTSFVSISATSTTATGIVALTTASAPYRGLS